MTVINNINNLARVGKSISDVNKVLGVTYTSSQARMAALKVSVDSLTASEAAELLAKKELSKQEIIQTIATKGLTEAEAEEVVTLAMANVEKQNAILQTGGLGYAYEALAAKIGMTSASLTATIGVIGAIVAAIGLAVYAINKANKQWEEMAERAEESKRNVSEVKESYEELEKTVTELGKRYEELSKGVDTFTNKNYKLSNEEYEEYLNIVNQLAELNPTLYKTLDENGNAIINFSDKTKTATENLQDFLDEEERVANIKIASELPDLFGGIRIKSKELNDASKKYENIISNSEEYISDLYQIIDLEKELNSELSFEIDISTEAGEASLDALQEGYEKWLDSLSEDRRFELESQDLSGNGLNILNINSPDGSSINDVLINTYSLSEDEIYALRASIKDATRQIMGDYTDSVGQAKDTLETSRKDLEAEWKDFTGNLISAMKSKAGYQGLDDANKELAQMLVGGLSSEISKQMDEEDPYDWVRDNIVTPLSEIEELDTTGEFSKLVTKLLTLDEDDIDRIDIVNQIQQWLKDNDINVEIDFTPVLKGSKRTAAINSSFNASLSHISEFAGDRKAAQADYKRLEEYTKDFSTEDKQTWLEVTRGCKSATEAINAFGNAQREAFDIPEKSDIVTSVENTATRLKPQFDALAKAYQAIFYGNDNDNQTFSLDNVDLDLMNEIRTTFLQIDKELEKSGVIFDVAPVNKFLDTITSAETKSKSLAEQEQITHDAINELATSYFYAADGLQDLNDETRDALQQQFKKMGITNAEEIVNQIQHTQEVEKEALEAFSNVSLDDIDFSDRIQEATDNLESEYEKIEEFGVGDYAKQIKEQTIQSVFGNVDMDKRAIITWSDELKETYKAELASWEYDPEIGSIDTVFGSSSAFWLGDQEVEIAFTPIIEVDGEAELIGQRTIDEYIQTICDEAAKDGNWSLDEILRLDRQGLEVNKYNEQGQIIGKQIVQGVIAGVGDKAIDISSLMHFSGEEGAIQLAEQALETYNNLKEKLETNTLSLENVTADEIEILKAEGLVSIAAGQQLAILALKKQLAAGITFGEQGNIDNIIALAKAAGVGAEYLTLLARAKSLAAQVDAQIAATGYSGRSAELEALQNQIENFDWQKDLQLDLDIQVDPASAKNNAGKAGKDAADEYKKQFDEELKKLKNSYDRGEITLAEYLAKYRALIEKYFSDTEKYAEERAQALHEYMEEMKSYYDAAISGVTTIIDHRIKAVQKQKDAALKAIEEERKAAKKALEERKKEIEKEIKLKQKQIKQLEKAKKPYEDEIEKIRKANEERKKEIELQKDLYELERLQNQRTQFIYKDGQMVYQADPNAMRDAREKVKEDEDEKKIEKLEKIIEGYDKQIELLNESIELLQEESDSIDEQLAAIDEFYDKLVEETTAAFDAILEQLEETKSKWEELAEIDKVASAWKDVGGVMEMLGYTVDDVLNDTPGAFDAFKEAYIACLAGMNGENDQYLEGLSRVTGKSVEELKKMMGEMETLGEKTKKPLKDTAEDIEKTGTKAETASGQIGTYASKMDEAASSAGKLDTNTKGISTNLDGINSSISNINGQPIQDLIDKFESLRAKLVEVKNALGTVATGSNGDQSLGGLAGTLQSLNGITFDTLIENFNALLKSVDAVTAALGGGGESSPLATNGGMPGTGEESGTTSHPSSGGGGLTGAIENVKKIADENIGTTAAGGGEDTESGSEEGGGTVISDFGALKETVDNVSSAIGTEDSESGEAEDGTLVSTLLNFKKTTADVMGNTEIADSVIGIWNSFKQEVEESAGIISEMIDKLNNELDKAGYETTLTVHLILDGDTEFTGTATRNGKHGNYSLNIMEAMGLPSESGDLVAHLNKKFTGTAKLSGTANLGGNWAYEGGKTLIAEIGPELVVYPNGRFETFDKPQIVNLPRGSVIFNHLQTSEILDGKNQITGLKGKSNLNGTLPSNLTPLSQSNPEQFNQFMQTAELLKANTDSMKTDLSNIGYATDDIRQAVQNITNNSIHMGTNITFGDLQFTCTGVTSSEVITEVGNALQREFAGLALNAYQRAVNMA